MEQDTLEQFQAALDALSDEAFAALWASIKAESGDGPTAEAFIANFDNTPSL